MVKPEHFYTRLDEEWRMMGKCDRARGYDLRVVTWWKLSKPCSFKFLSAPRCLQG